MCWSGIPPKFPKPFAIPHFHYTTFGDWRIFQKNCPKLKYKTVLFMYIESIIITQIQAGS